MRTLLTVALLFCILNISASENSISNESNSIATEVVSEKDLLSEAKLLRNKEPANSLKLAKQALELSLKNKNSHVAGQVYSLLGKLAKQSKNNEQALTYFLQASLQHKSINDTRHQIVASVDYINLLLSAKRYQQADNSIEELLPIAQQYQKPWPLALTLIAKADSYYLQKSYKNANEQYEQAVTLLVASDKLTQKKLGETYKKLAQSFKRLKDREQTAEYYKKALDVFTALKDKKNMARTLNTLAEAERYLDHLLVALDYSTRGLEIHKQIDDEEGYAKASMGAGIIYRHIGRYEKSLEHIYNAHLYYQKVNDINGIAETSNQLGFIYTRLKQFDEARSFYQLAIDVAGDKIKRKTLASSLREMAVIYLNDEDYESALVMVEQAHKIYIKENEKLKRSITARIMANIYRDQKKYEQAIAYYEESLVFAKESGNKAYEIKAQAALAGLLINTKTEQAIKQLRESVELSIQIDDKVQTLYAYRKLRQAEKILGNFEESLHYAEEEIKLSEIIQKDKDKQELILIKAKLYSHTREIELENLREKTRLDQLELAKKNNEIEIAEKTRLITELQLTKNKYANITLGLLLGLSILLVVFIYRLFIASNKRNKELDYLAARDPLTHCYNRRALFEHMYRDFEKSGLLEQYCIIMVDIDHFKEVNDTYGHNMGDSVICGVAEILQACIGQKDIVSRFGGEEFCVYLHEATENEAVDIAESMRRQIEDSRFGEISVTCCFGVSSITFNAKSYLELINQADIALYQSKLLGRNKVTLWNNELDKKDNNEY